MTICTTNVNVIATVPDRLDSGGNNDKTKRNSETFYQAYRHLEWCRLDLIQIDDDNDVLLYLKLL